MFTGITRHAGALVTAVVVLTGATILSCGAAVADPNQDDQFLALLDQEEIPAVKNVPSVIAAGHKVCRKLDDGTPVDDIVDAMRNDAYNIDPVVRRHPVRVTSTVTRFITAAVGAYCPYDQSKIASMAANPMRGSSESTHPVAAYWPNVFNSGVLASLIRAVPSGEITPPNPPQIPAPPPPTAQVQTPQRTNAAPPAPQQPPPTPQRPPPLPQDPPPPAQEPPSPPEQAPAPQQPQSPPQQAEPPAAAPQPGGAPDGGSGSSGGGNGRGDPAEPSPSMPPGFVRLAP
jgi:hypothetical protein